MTNTHRVSKLAILLFTLAVFEPAAAQARPRNDVGVPFLRNELRSQQVGDRDQRNMARESVRVAQATSIDQREEAERKRVRQLEREQSERLRQLELEHRNRLRQLEREHQERLRKLVREETEHFSQLTQAEKERYRQQVRAAERAR